MTRAGDRLAELDGLEGDPPSWDEMVEQTGAIGSRLPDVGEAALDLEHTAALYWPAVPPGLEPRPRRGVPTAP